MISDITLGQFFPGASLLHKLDPRTKILLAIMYIVALFMANNPAAFGFMLILTVLLIAISKISFKVIIRGVRPIIFVLIFTSIINILMTDGKGEPLVDFWIIEIFKEGIIKAVFMSIRVVMLIIGTSMFLTYTTSPISLTDGIESLLWPLKKIKIPVHLFAMMMTIALRFIPTLVEETEKIMNAQKSRGADFSSGGLIKRAKALIPILVPLFVSSFKRAEDLAQAMECRCYRGDKNRTKYVELRYRLRDFAWLGLSALLLAVVILSRILPYEFAIANEIYRIVFYVI